MHLPSLAAVLGSWLLFAANSVPGGFVAARPAAAQEKDPAAATTQPGLDLVLDGVVDSLVNVSRRDGRLGKRARGEIKVSTLHERGVDVIPDIDWIRRNTQVDFVRGKTCIFYAGIPDDGQLFAYRWYECNIKNRDRDPVTGEVPRDPVALTQSMDWALQSQILDNCRDVDAITAHVPGEGLEDDGLDIWAVGTFDGLRSRVFAETCEGTVYFLTTQNFHALNPPTDTVWWQYELPALIAGGRVTNIVQANPNFGVVEQNGAVLNPILAWNRASGNPGLGAPRGGYRYTSERRPGTTIPDLEEGQDDVDDSGSESGSDSGSNSGTSTGSP
ncbi:hypothetical protein VTK73DRAFT_7374 [Phialemonium thermophilum]|uniref:Uncharacterized protein n=1 Tax=Phialemonium thermophilum TaxID=223376 RepID=A0ABR3WF82_9PEZI